MFVEAVNRTYGAGLNPLSDQRVLLNSGDLGSLPTTETFFDINDLVIRDQLTRTWAGGTGSLTDDSQWVEGARPYLPDVAVFDQVGSHELIVNGAESVAVGQFVSGDVNIGTHVLVGTTSTPGGSSLRFADQLSLEGGSLKVNQLHVAPDGTFNFDVGKLTIDGGIFDHSSQHLKFGLGSRDLSLLNGAEAHLQSMSFGNFNTLGTNSFRIEGGTTTVDASVVVDGVTMTVADADLQFGDTLRIGSTQSIFGNPIPFAGTFVHNGGTTAGDIVSIGDTSTGDYTISAGTLDVNSIVAGNNTESATFDGVGTFTQTGGNVVVTDAITLGAHADSQGTYQLDGGTLTAGSINISPDSSFNFTGGALRTVQFVGDLAQDGGLITIGNSPGVMDIDGNYLMNAGTLEIELGGYLAGTEFDFLDVSGTAMLDGQLDVLFIDGFLPGQIGDSFAILEADGGITLGSGFVASLPDLSHLGPHSAWQVNVSGNSLALSVVPEPSSMAFAGMAGCFGVAVATRRRRNSCQTSA